MDKDTALGLIDGINLGRAWFIPGALPPGGLLQADEVNGSQLGWPPPQGTFGHLAVSADIVGCHKCREWRKRGTGIQWVEARDTETSHNAQDSLPTTKKRPAPNASSAEVEMPGLGEAMDVFRKSPLGGCGP